LVSKATRGENPALAAAVASATRLGSVAVPEMKVSLRNWPIWMLECWATGCPSGTMSSNGSVIKCLVRTPTGVPQAIPG
jgi:hypothetical protein